MPDAQVLPGSALDLQLEPVFRLGLQVPGEQLWGSFSAGYFPGKACTYLTLASITWDSRKPH